MTLAADPPAGAIRKAQPVSPAKPAKAGGELLLQMAYGAYESGNMALALEKIDAAEKAQQSPAECANLRGAIYLRTGLYPKAVEQFKRAVNLDPSFWVARFNVAEVPFRQKDFPAARKAFENLAFETDRYKQDTEWELVQYKLIVCDLLTGDAADAQKRFTRLRSNPASTAKIFSQAALSFAKNDNATANKVLSLAGTPGSPGLKAIYADALVAAGWLAPPASTSATNVASAGGRGSLRVRGLPVPLLPPALEIDLPKGAGPALSADSAVPVDEPSLPGTPAESVSPAPKSPPAKSDAAPKTPAPKDSSEVAPRNDWRFASNDENAPRWIRAANESTDAYATKLREAQAKLKSKDFDGASQLLEEAAALAPNPAEALNLRGALEYYRGNYRAAESLFRKALAADPASWTAKFNIAEISFVQKEYTRARAQYEEMLPGTNATKQPVERDLLQYKIFLTQLLEGRLGTAEKISERLPLGGATPARYYAQVALNISRKRLDKAAQDLAAAEQSYPASLNFIFAQPLEKLAMLPLGADPSAALRRRAAAAGNASGNAVGGAPRAPAHAQGRAPGPRRLAAAGHGRRDAARRPRRKRPRAHRGAVARGNRGWTHTRASRQIAKHRCIDCGGDSRRTAAATAPRTPAPTPMAVMPTPTPAAAVAAATPSTEAPARKPAATAESEASPGWLASALQWLVPGSTPTRMETLLFALALANLLGLFYLLASDIIARMLRPRTMSIHTAGAVGVSVNRLRIIERLRVRLSIANMTRHSRTVGHMDTIVEAPDGTKHVFHWNTLCLNPSGSSSSFEEMEVFPLVMLPGEVASLYVDFVADAEETPTPWRRGRHQLTVMGWTEAATTAQQALLQGFVPARDSQTFPGSTRISWSISQSFGRVGARESPRNSRCSNGRTRNWSRWSPPRMRSSRSRRRIPTRPPRLPRKARRRQWSRRHPRPASRPRGRPRRHPPRSSRPRHPPRSRPLRWSRLRRRPRRFRSRLRPPTQRLPSIIGAAPPISGQVRPVTPVVPPPAATTQRANADPANASARPPLSRTPFLSGPGKTTITPRVLPTIGRPASMTQTKPVGPLVPMIKPVPRPPPRTAGAEPAARTQPRVEAPATTPEFPLLAEDLLAPRPKVPDPLEPPPKP